MSWTSANWLPGSRSSGPGGLAESVRVAQVLTGSQDVHRPAEQRRLAQRLAVNAGGEGDAGVPADEPGAEILDHVRVGGLDLRRVEGLEAPPAQVQRQEQAAVDSRRVKINEPFMAALRDSPTPASGCGIARSGATWSSSPSRPAA